MKIETQSSEQVTETPTQPDLSKLSFPEYERVRRGESLESEENKSALAGKKPAEQNQTSESETEETATEEETADNTEADESEEDLDAKGDESKVKPKRKSGFKRRVDKLNSKIAAKDAEIEHWRTQAIGRGDAGEKQNERESKPTTKTSEEGKPNPEDFETHAAFVEALTDWKIEKRDKDADAKKHALKLADDQQTQLKSYADRAKAFAEKHADFNEVLDEVDDVIVSPAVKQLIVESEDGPALAYELAKNREELSRLSKLAPLAAAREFGKLEAKIAAAKSKVTEEKPKKLTTEAPDPIAPVGGGRGGVAKSIDDPNISFSEYEKIRNRQLKSKR